MGVVLRILAILAICAPLLAPLHTPGLLNPDEGRYAEIGREMAASGDWLVPRLNGVPHWAKPPLTYWAIAASLNALGASERAARLPAAVAATLALAATWFLARRMIGDRGAVLSVFMLAAMIEFHLLGRFITADMMQTAFITWAAALAWSARTPPAGHDGKRTRPAFLRRMAPFACLGLAFLAKGPVGLGVFFSGLLVFLVLRPRTSIVTWRDLVPGLLVTLAIGAPWFLRVVRLHPDLADFFLGGEVRDRVLTSHGRGKELWFYPLVITAGTLPWTPVLAAALGRMIADLRRRAPAAAGDGDAGRFLLAWIAGPFILFSLSGSKLFSYLLPLMPICAIAAARWIAALPDAAGTSRGWITSVASAPAVIALGAAIAAVSGYGGAPAPWSATAAGAVIASLVVLGFIWLGRGLRPATAICASALIMLGWYWSAALAIDENMKLRSHASHAWIREALAGETIRGVPIREAVRPVSEPPAGPPPTLVRYDLKAHTIGLYALGLRPEFVPAYGIPEEWEIQSDQDVARTPTLAELAALLGGPERVHVIARASSQTAIETAAGRPLRVVGSHGIGEHAIVLLASR